mmetsp:Transcript_14741/g.17159  ORF Transcript_14741/g.17159 Transcript_14741/m.17159 type:complete len:465 (-) Transcript_14741:1718-3112(-)
MSDESLVSELSFAVSIIKSTRFSKVGIAFASDESSTTVAKVSGLAEEAGLSVGDRIVSINGVSTINMDGKEACKIIRDSEGAVRIEASTAARPYVWPDLYNEIGGDIVVTATSVVYLLAMLNHCVKTQESATPKYMKQVAEENIDVLTKTFKGKFNLTIFQEQMDELQSKSDGGINPYTFVRIDSDYESKELVFMITKDRVDKRINLCFRGTALDNGFEVLASHLITDLSISKEKVEVPDSLKGELEQGDFVLLHEGFYKNLFKETVTTDDDEGTTKYEEILSVIKSLLLQHPDYKLYVTGHSMGGALATICSFFLASEPDIVGPVTCIAYSAPRVGDRQFLAATQHLEKMGELRIIRVNPDNDTIPTTPVLGYAHVGFQVRLFENENKLPDISYPNLQQGFWSWFAISWSNSVIASLNFGYDHSDQINRVRYANTIKFLQKISLNDLYNDDTVVGFKINEDYE